MKTKKKSYYLVISIFIFIIGCKNSTLENPPEPEIGGGHYIPMLTEDIVKIKDTSLLKYVCVDCVLFDYWNGKEMIPLTSEGAYQMRFRGNSCQEFFLGSSPYIELDSGYYLIDWKWGNFVYVQQYLIDVKWEDVENRQQIWPKNTKVITRDFYTFWACLSRKKIDQLLNIIPAPDADTTGDEKTGSWGPSNTYGISTDHLKPFFYERYNSIDDLPQPIFKYHNGDEYTIEDYKKEVIRQDSLQQEYVKRLNLLIKNGEIENYKITYDSNI